MIRRKLEQESKSFDLPSNEKNEKIQKLLQVFLILSANVYVLFLKTVT